MSEAPRYPWYRGPKKLEEGSVVPERETELHPRTEPIPTPPSVGGSGISVESQKRELNKPFQTKRVK